MSEHDTNWVLADRTTKGDARLVLLVLTTVADDEYLIDADIETIADLANCSIRSVRRSIATLTALGYVTTVHSGGGRGGRAVRRLTLPITDLATFEEWCGA